MSEATKIQVQLTGGPAGIPAVLDIDSELLPDGRLKVPFAAGYEHFELIETETPGATPVFAWSTRTRIAE
ncbi:hypothetical protein GCM10027445_59790 [Amycolatopsis endophytica]|uniref:Uncharacterized protein n=1 Tax=Amycolatopsis endophytica TaxID=860233 RepID=A0A853AZY7_9PSEU|nr:DUF5988 family protein [Amycolatopsis endophytica]NYI88111.1 hypothetical protein [Amycolatopsis endophytica]